MTMLHISSADLLYSLYLQLMYGVAFVGVFQPWLCQRSSLSMILLIAGMRCGLESVESPFTMSASVWLSTMIFMQCVFSLCGLHSSFVPSVVCLLLSSSFVALCCVVLVWGLVSCLSIGPLLVRVLWFGVVWGFGSSSVFVVSGLDGMPSGAMYLFIRGLHSLIQLRLVWCVFGFVHPVYSQHVYQHLVVGCDLASSALYWFAGHFPP